MFSTWQRWGDIIVDCGRELDTPKQLLAGKMLYRDVRYWYGPAAPYVNALLYRVLGVRVGVLVASGVATAAAISWLTYCIVRLLADRFAAAAAAVAVLYINAFPQCYVANIFNFVLPYAYPATYGTLATMASVYFLLRHVLTGRPAPFLISCSFLAIAALCKLEVLFAVGMTHLLFVVMWVGISRRAALYHLWGYLAALTIPVAVYAWFFAHTGRALLTDNLLLSSNVTTGSFVMRHSGLADPTAALGQMAWSAAGIGVCLALIAFLAWAESKWQSGRVPAASTRFLSILAGVGAAALCGVISFLLGPPRIFRALPLVLVVTAVIAAARVITRRRHAAQEMVLLTLTVFALASGARILLRYGAEHYGFYLMLPGAVALAVIWCRALPTVAGRGAPTRSAGICGAVTMLLVAMSHAQTTRKTAEIAYGPGEPPRVRTAQGTMVCRRDYVGSVDEAIRFMSTLPATTKVVVLPEGSAITFLAGLTNALGMHTFLPLDFSGSYDEPAIIARLAAADPDYILFSPRSAEEYGKQGLGLDYGLQLMEWVQDHYILVKELRTRYNAVCILGKPVPTLPASAQGQ